MSMMPQREFLGLEISNKSSKVVEDKRALSWDRPGSNPSPAGYLLGVLRQVAFLPQPRFPIYG